MSIACALFIALSSMAGASGSDTPIPLYWKDANGRLVNVQPVGRLYTAAALARLVASLPEATPSARLGAAIRNDTPIVLMWDLPASPEFGVFPRPYRIGIVEQGGDLSGPHVEALWTDRDATDLRRVDTTTTFKDVGAVAAFPRDAFRRGRLVQMTSGAQGGAGRRVQRAQVWATIEWDGTLK